MRITAGSSFELCVSLVVAPAVPAGHAWGSEVDSDRVWPRYIIDASAVGAVGVRFGDYSDRRGPTRGVWWLENTSEGWHRHPIGAIGTYEAMFADVGDLDHDGLEAVIVAVRDGPIRFHRRQPAARPAFETSEIQLPVHMGTGKSVAIDDPAGNVGI